jgi:hypothetical protein
VLCILRLLFHQFTYAKSETYRRNRQVCRIPLLPPSNTPSSSREHQLNPKPKEDTRYKTHDLPGLVPAILSKVEASTRMSVCCFASLWTPTKNHCTNLVCSRLCRHPMLSSSSAPLPSFKPFGKSTKINNIQLHVLGAPVFPPSQNPPGPNAVPNPRNRPVPDTCPTFFRLCLSALCMLPPSARYISVNASCVQYPCQSLHIKTLRFVRYVVALAKSLSESYTCLSSCIALFIPWPLRLLTTEHKFTFDTPVTWAPASPSGNKQNKK